MPHCSGARGNSRSYNGSRTGGGQNLRTSGDYTSGAGWEDAYEQPEAGAGSSLSCFVEVRFRGQARRTAAVESDMPLWNEQVSRGQRDVCIEPVHLVATIPMVVMQRR